MKTKHLIGFLAALLVLAFFSVALVVHDQTSIRNLAWALGAASFALGTVTVTYQVPVSGTSAPTAAQVYGLGLVTAQVNNADTDASITITHNFGLDAGELAALYPFVIINQDSGGTTLPAYEISKATNSVTITKASTSGTGGTFDVCVWRPPTNQRPRV
jgi:hypothetical protein